MLRIYFVKSFRKLPQLNNQGLSLVELMIAVGVMGIISLFTGQVISDMIASKNTADYYAVRQTVRSDLNNFLIKNNTCRCSFRNVVIPGNVGINAPAIPITTLDIYLDPDDLNCPPATIKKNVIRTNAVYDKTLVAGMELGQFQRLSDRQFLSRLVVTLQSQRRVNGPKQLVVEMPIPLQVSDVGGGAYIITGCGQQPPDEFKVIDDGITQNLRGGIRTYTFPNMTGRSLGLVQFNFRWGKNFDLDILPLNARNTRTVIDNYNFNTGQDGHIRHGTFLATIPLVNGQFTANFNCRCGGNANRSSMTLLATIPVL